MHAYRQRWQTLDSQALKYIHTYAHTGKESPIQEQSLACMYVACMHVHTQASSILCVHAHKCYINALMRYRLRLIADSESVASITCVRTSVSVYEYIHMYTHTTCAHLQAKARRARDVSDSEAIASIQPNAYGVAWSSFLVSHGMAWPDGIVKVWHPSQMFTCMCVYACMYTCM
jgi:hypothetical protein